MTDTFETALSARVAAMADACTRCGKCVEVCPVTGPGGVDAEPRAVIAGVIDILRTGDGPDASRKWASACVAANEAPAMRRRGVENFRNLSQGVNVLARLQLDEATLDRLAQTGKKLTERPDEAPDFVFYTGCNVLKTPHIALLALDIMDAIGVTYQVLGGPSHCCGIVQMRTGDVATSGRFAESTMDKLARSKSGQVVSWCPSCHVQFTETTLPTIEKTRGARPFEMTPFMLFLRGNLDRLRPFLRRRVDMRVALHRHPGIKGVVEAAEDILRAVPGVELIDLKQPAVGLMSNYFRALPAYRRELQKNELDAAERAGIDALVAVYHADHRELCAHERDYPFRIVNMLEIVGDSMGLHHDDHFKRLKMLQDVDAIAADCQDLIAQHGLDPATTRAAVPRRSFPRIARR
ncbi:MAG: (Fe-S)-binding protein [Alphaproteobacteria bacterium]|nr:MAG: (Fe-S)-binding protein [Alphaproteobacteria bacterium]